jgi:hypothetical protein
MGVRLVLPLRVLLPCLAVSLVAAGAAAIGVAGVSAADGFAIRQADDAVRACESSVLNHGPVTVPGYDLVVTTADGKQTPVATWKPATSDQASGLAAATGIPTSQIRTVDIRVSGTSTPLAVTTVH